MTLASQVADHWLRRILLAAYSPEFYRWVWLKRFRNPETDRYVLFHSLPSQEQQKIHDEWQQGQGGPKVQMPGREFRKLRQRAIEGEPDHEELEAAKKDRREMAEQIKKLKERGAPAKILQKERKRLLQEMEIRKRQRAQARAQAETPMHAP